MNVSLISSDSLSGVRWLNYSVDGVWHEYTRAFSLSEGTHVLKFNATDLAGNTEQIQTLSIRIDETPPTTQVSEDKHPNTEGWYRASVNIVLNHTDSLSGFNATYYRIDGGAWNTYSRAFNITDDGIHNIEYYSVDNAGNTAHINKLNISIDKKIPRIINYTSNISINGGMGHIAILFNKPMNVQSVYNNISLGTNIKVSDILWSNDNTKLEIYFKNAAYGKNYNIYLHNISDLHGNTRDFSLSVRTQKTPSESPNLILILLLSILFSILIVAFIILRYVRNNSEELQFDVKENSEELRNSISEVEKRIEGSKGPKPPTEEEPPKNTIESNEEWGDGRL